MSGRGAGRHGTVAEACRSVLSTERPAARDRAVLPRSTVGWDSSLSPGRRRDALAAVTPVEVVAPSPERREGGLLAERDAEHRPHRGVEREELVRRVPEDAGEHARDGEVGAREAVADEMRRLLD